MEKQTEQKKALVLDTNFIVQHVGQINEIVKRLSEDFSVYLPQISLDERIAQKIREMKKQYLELEKCKRGIPTVYCNIVFTRSMDQAGDIIRTRTQVNYEKMQFNRIIPFSASKKMLEIVLQRANDKIPPFSSVENASDKGFKDTLIWLSVLDYFKEEGEDGVIFMTDDGAFAKYSAELKTEFFDYTGKVVDFKTNAFYKELTRKEEDTPLPKEPEKQEPLPEVSFLRKEIDDAYEAIVLLESEDYYGNPRWDRTFTIYEIVDETYAKAFFDGLRNRIQAHMLEAKVFPSELLSVGNVEIVDKERITMDRFEAVLKLYESVERNYPQYLDSLYLAFAQRINENYEMKPFSDISSDDLPF